DANLLETLSVIGSQVGQFMERKEAEESVRRSEAHKSAILETAPDCVLTLDGRGRVIESNPAAERTFGYDEEALAGMALADLVALGAGGGDGREEVAPYLSPGRESLLGRRVEATGIRADGSRFPVELAVAQVDVD